MNSQTRKEDGVRVHNIYRIGRDIEEKHFAQGIGNIRPLFHGSRISNWVWSKPVLLNLPVNESLSYIGWDPIAWHSHASDHQQWQTWCK